ncbi:uncharacterized protein LOC128207375 [Mya arenaria]|nr:uncharacterized protein LOC128207375 [Mya arenaria]
MDRKLKLFHDCDHVSYLADQLYVASNRTVYQYTLTGQRVRKMDGWDMWGFALNPDGNRLYITDFDNNRLLTADMHGRGLAILADEDIKGPTGVCVSPCGKVFVCGSHFGTIIQIDSEGKHKLSIQATKEDRVSSPLSVYFDIRTSSLLVGQSDDADLLVLILK